MIVMKFGGTSLGEPDRVYRVGRIVRQHLPRDPVVVVSALGGMTDMLLDLAAQAAGGQPSCESVRDRHHEMLVGLHLPADLVDPLLEELDVLLRGISMVRELTPRTQDFVVSFGERMSARIVAAHMTSEGVRTRAWDAFDAGMLTDDRFGGARPVFETDGLLAQHLGTRRDGVPVVTGYIGKTKKGEITTLGRNGSDFTASLLGAALRAEEIQIWSDVDGVMTADPKLIPTARSIERMSFAEAGELAYYGGRIHPASLLPAMQGKIPVRMLNTFRPEAPGTLILHDCPPEGTAKSIVSKRNLILIQVSSAGMLQQSGFMARLFEILGRHGIVIDMIATSEVTVSLTTDSDRNLEAAVRDLSQVAEVIVLPDRAIVCVVGEGIRTTPGVAGDVFMALKEAQVNLEMISHGANRINLAFLVHSRDVATAVTALHRAFFPDGDGAA